MEIRYERCCGLDVHKRTVVACRRVSGPVGAPSKQIRTFATMTRDLLALADWLAAAGCTHVAMESTGVFWQPIYNLLEDRFALLVVNAAHSKAVPGRKTDVRAAEWSADLLRHGLLRPSFIPDRPQREVRDLTRYRTTLIHERANEVNRLRDGCSKAPTSSCPRSRPPCWASRDARSWKRWSAGRATAPPWRRWRGDGCARSCRNSRRRCPANSARSSASGSLEHLPHSDFLDASLERISAEIAERVRPFEAEVVRVQSIPGGGRRTAEVLVAEIGVDLSRFPTARHLAAWAGLCPGNEESAGKRRRGRTRNGSPWLRTALVEAGQAAARTKETSLAAQ